MPSQATKKRLRKLLIALDPSSKADLLVDQLKEDNNENLNELVKRISLKFQDIKASLLAEFDTRLSQLPDVTDEIKSLRSEFETKLQSLEKEDIGTIQTQMQDMVSNEIDTDENLKEELGNKIEEVRREFLRKLSNLGGGAQNQRIQLNGTTMSTRYADFNLLNGTGITITGANNDTTKQVDITINSTADLSVTLADVSANSLTTPNSLYTMTSGIPVEFRSSDGNTILYLDETNERVGFFTSTPAYKIDFVLGSSTDVYGVQIVRTYTGLTSGTRSGLRNQVIVNPGASANASNNSAFFNTVETDASSSGNLTSSVGLVGSFYEAIHRGTGTVTKQIGQRVLSSLTGLGTTTTRVGVNAFLTSATGGIVTTSRSFEAQFTDEAGTITTSQVLYGPVNAVATHDWGVYMENAKNYMAGLLEFAEISIPTTPGSNLGRLYVKDDGSGTSALFFLDDAGIEIQLGSGGGGGSTTFLSLTDTPDTYASQALKIVRVNSTEDALEFATTVPVAQGGTNIASYTAGDLIYASASTTFTKLAIGTSGLYLQSNGSAPVWVGAVDLTTAQAVAGVKTFSSFPVTPSSSPTTSYQVANKQYVDSVALGLEPKASCRIATVIAGTLASSFENLDTVDGVALATGDRILIKDQVTGSENGIYTVNASGAPTRATDSDTSAEVQEGTSTYITAGTVNANKIFAQITVDPVLDTSILTYTQVGAVAAYTASLGVELVGSDFRSDLLSTGAITLTGNEIGVATDGSSIEISSNALRVKALGITNAMLAGSIADSKLSQITTADKVSGAAITLLTSVPSGAGLLPNANLASSGTPDSTTFLRGDRAWAVPAGTGSGSVTINYSELLNTDTTAVTITNSAVETTIYTYTIAANTLGTDKAVALKLFGSYRQFSGSNKTVRVRVKLGATTLMDRISANIGTNTTAGYWGGEVFLQNTGAASEQHAFMRFTFEQGGASLGAASSDISVVDRATSAEDTTADRAFVVTIQLSAATATQTFVRQGAVLNMLNSSDTLGAPIAASYVTLAAHADLTNERVLTGTSNQITLTDGGAGGAITLSTPQDIATASTPQFGGLGINAAASSSTFLLHGAATTAKSSQRMPVGTAPTSPVEGDIWSDSTAKSLVGFVDGIKQGYVGDTFIQTTAVNLLFSTIATTETTLTGAGSGTLTLPANFLTAGKTIRVTARGIYTTNASGSKTIRIRFRLGGLAGTVVGDTTAIASTNSLTNAGWEASILITCYTTGAGGTVWAQGWFAPQTAATTRQVWPMVNTGTVTIDTTSAQAVDLTLLYGSGVEVTAQMTCSNLVIEAVNNPV